MLPILLNNKLEKLNIIDTFSSFIWCERYYTHGEFELVFGYKSEYADLLEQAYFVARDDDLRNIGVIEQLKIQLKENGGYIVTLAGRFATCLLERRVIQFQTICTGTVSNICHEVFRTVAGPDNNMLWARVFPYLDDDISDSFTDTLQIQWTGKTGFEALSDLCKRYSLGTRVHIKRDAVTHETRLGLEVFEAKDRSINQSENTKVIFSHKYDNLINAEYIKDVSETVNAVYIAGEGEGGNRKIALVTTTGQWNSPSDYYGTGSRFETFVDARDIQSQTEDGTLTTEEYAAQLEARGKLHLAKENVKLSGKVNFNMVEYRQDVDIGDIVTIELAPLNRSFDTRIIEVIESIDSSGAYSITPTFENVERSEDNGN